MLELKVQQFMRWLPEKQFMNIQKIRLKQLIEARKAVLWPSLAVASG